MEKPYAPACDRNKGAILEKLAIEFGDVSAVLEIGSGTGQHAVYFAEHLPHVVWQPTDCAENLAGIGLWVEESGLKNLAMPLDLDVTKPWPVTVMYEGLFSANTVHIMSWPVVEVFFSGIGRHLAKGGIFCLYGPFNYAGRYTSESNAEFDIWLKQRDPLSSIRDFEAINRLAEAAGLLLARDYPMPANNRLLVWKKQ